MRPIKKGSTDQSVVIRIIDSTDGTPENGVEHNTAGIDLWYRREKETKTSITEAALAALDSAHSDGGIELIGDGYYRLDLPDAAWATGADGVMIGGTVTGMIVIGNYHALVDYDPYDAVRMGMTALPNAAADAAGGLPISDAGSLDIDTKLANTNEVTAARMGALTDLINGGRLDLILDELTAQGDTNETKIDNTYDCVDDIGVAGNALTAIPWNAAWDAQVESECADALTAYDPPTRAELTTDKDSIITEVNANETKIDTVDTVVDAIKAKTDNLPADPASETNVDANETKIDTVDTVVDAIKAKTDNLPAAPATEAKQDTIDTVVDGIQTDLSNATDGLGALKTLIDAVDTIVDAIKAKTDNLPSGIPKNVALSNFGFFMVDSADHITPKIGLAITAQISKDGGGFAGAANAAAEIANGVYKIDLTQAEMNADVIVLKFTAAGADQRTITIKTDS